MPLRYDTEEEQEERTGRRSMASGRAASSDTEIALGTRSLLAIFFGLVLICAVFFGLGYSVGRGSGTRAAVQPATETAAVPADSHLSKPSADQALTPVEAAPGEAGGSPIAETPAPEPSRATTTAPATASAPVATPVNPAPSPATAQGARTATLQPAAATSTTSFMVQVAAVRVPQDAQILVDALKKHGYTAVVRNEPQDQLLHIQLGPYSARSDANAARAKLLTDGYNAVVK